MLSSFRRFASAPVIGKYSRPCRSYSGLLSGVNSVEAIKQSKFYAASLNIEETADFMKKNKYLYEAAKRDVANPTKDSVDKYINDAMKKAEAFILKKEVWDREEIKEQLQSVFTKKGEFVCLLGGKSTGKSLLLKEVDERRSHWTLLVNMRSAVPLMKALNNELRKSQKLKDLLKEIGEKGMATAAVVADAVLKMELFEKVNAIIMKPNNASTPEQSYERDLEVFNAIITFTTFFNGRLTIIIDEANIAFDTSRSTPNEIKETKTDLDLFVKLTKETSAVNIVLASSEHSFPYKLEALGFKTGEFSEFLFMGEVPPDKMYELLTEVWGMRENLAIAFMEFYGGHVYDCFKAINKLALQKEKFRAETIYMGSHEGITRTLFKFKGTEHEKTAKEYLTALATHGFLLTPEGLEDRVAQYLSEKNVAGMVTNDGVTVGLPETVWTGALKFGLIPAKQSTRMMIAEQLNELKPTYCKMNQ